MLAARTPDRLDRHVRHSHVRMGAGESRHRVRFALEEALRLAELPGEREGRVYYFRKVSLGAIPAQASRLLWMASVQQALAVSAGAALHGCDPRADAADVVYFDNEEQAVELQLRRALHPGSPPTWFTPAALAGAPAGGESSSSILRIVEWLRQSMPPKAAATLILAALGNTSPVELLARLPIGAVRAWLQERDTGRGAAPDAPAISLPRHLQPMLEQTAVQFGWKEPHTVWLATLIVQSLAPAAAVETAVRRARATLQQIAAEGSAPLEPGAAIPRPPDDLAQVVFAAGERPEHVEAGSGVAENEASEASASDGMGAHSNAGSPLAAKRPVRRPAVFTPLLGEPTAAAGLYFLLQALRQLGIKDALASHPELAATNFVARILRLLAARSGVPVEDPILWCLDMADAEFPESAPAHLDIGALVRLWAVRVRRWCWREGRITAREIVNRDGHVWLTRTDLDVTLPMDHADVRIRRIGLDIDPGWLPWFGRIVRFHYRERDPQ
jgi:hypothetical protein